MFNIGTKTKKTTALVILDGWGIAPVWGGNAIATANVRNFNTAVRKFPSTTLRASEVAVGLPLGAPGNSEAGHLNIGAGRIVHQDQPIIDKMIEDGSFFSNPTLLAAIAHAKKNNSNLNLIGLLSKTGTHSQINHLYALLKLCKSQNFDRVYIHLFGDGRDSEPTTGIEMASEVLEKIAEIGVGQVATIIGRFYAMDRDNHWERISFAYKLLTQRIGKTFENVGSVFGKSYAHGITDEFLEASVIINKEKSSPPISSNDAIIFFNFRADRTRELTKAFLDPNLAEMPNRQLLTNLFFCSFVMHGDRQLAKQVFVPEKVENPLAAILSSNNRLQYHTAETEKYAHVTYFLNGGSELPFAGEDRRMIQSPRSVRTYDLKPEMSADELTSTFLQAYSGGKYDFMVINFANADMVGHTGNLKATITAVEFIDVCLGQILSKFSDNNDTVFVCADHGNAEQMVNPKTGEPDTEHTCNPVPFILINQEMATSGLKLGEGGILGSIAPTILETMGISFDIGNKEKSLIIHEDARK